MFLKLSTTFAFLAIINLTTARPHHFSSPYSNRGSSISFPYQAAPSPYPHRAVLENDAQEALYPEYFRNPYYKSPRVRDFLARFSSLQYNETPVENRIADHVPRKEIYKLLTHAGLVKREDYPYAK